MDKVYYWLGVVVFWVGVLLSIYHAIWYIAAYKWKGISTFFKNWWYYAKVVIIKTKPFGEKEAKKLRFHYHNTPYRSGMYIARRILIKMGYGDPKESTLSNP